MSRCQTNVPPYRRPGFILFLVLAAVAFGIVGSILFAPDSDQDKPHHDAGPDHPPATHGAATAAAPTLGGPQPRTGRRHQPELGAAVDRLRQVDPVAPSTSRRYRRIGDRACAQADLYAEAFTRRLLRQDYTGSRHALLAWVQAEAVKSREPLVVGLVPQALRGRLAVATVQDGVNGPAPVPTRTRWATLARRHGHTSVHIIGVSTPPAWTQAVAAGGVSDPGATVRQVDAVLTVHTRRHGRKHTTRWSVAVTMNLEGPPTRPGYGFVSVITYRAVPIGG